MHPYICINYMLVSIIKHAKSQKNISAEKIHKLHNSLQCNNFENFKRSN